MRRIGFTRDLRCEDESPCSPWSKRGCHNCPHRPMKLYSGNSIYPKMLPFCQMRGIGLIATRYRDPERMPYYALDNGMFGVWNSGQEWGPDRFINMLKKYKERHPSPDFAVVPDKVAEGYTSLEFSLEWKDELPDMNTNEMLAVQDGMDREMVEPYIHEFDGIFVGGTKKWKLDTAQGWVEMAHEHDKPCHIARISHWKHILWACDIGADSIDSSSWLQGNKWYYIDYAIQAHYHRWF